MRTCVAFIKASFSVTQGQKQEHYFHSSVQGVDAFPWKLGKKLKVDGDVYLLSAAKIVSNFIPYPSNQKITRFAKLRFHFAKRQDLHIHGRQ